MSEIPAFCDKCGTVFGSGFVFENCRNVSLSGNKVGPCPACGGTGSIPDGVYEFTGNAIRLISGSLKTVQNLSKLSKLLVDAQKRNLTHEQVSNSIETQVPELHSFASVLPKTRNELYAFIAIILTAIGLMMVAYNTPQNDEISESDIQKLIDLSIEKSIVRQQTVKPIESIKKQKRNDPCACGSEVKYKKCCYLSI
jgi:hypothetical protein